MARGLEKGTTLAGRFRLEELVGTGGMGSVYAATDLERGHRVALKVLRRRYAERTDLRERFVAESQAAQRIPHPHILTVHDHGVDAGWHYIAMELAPTDLASLLELEGTLPVTRALNVAEQIAWALDVAHEHGVIHRDVKPENVLVRPRRSEDEPDHAYLADFGIAKLETAERGLTRTGVFMGTVNYASPEQAAGGPLDGRSDQYALACVLFECLTGRVPFPAGGAEAVLLAHRRDARPAASTLRPALPAALDAVLARGMAIDPEERYETCRALVAAARAAVRAPQAPQAPEAPAPTVTAAPAAPPSGGAPTETAPTGEAPVPSRRILAGAAVLAVAAAIGLAVVLTGGDEPAPRADGPGTSGPAADDAVAAESAVRQTVRAFGAARGAAATCATLAAERRSSCASTYETAQPAFYEVRQVDLGDDVADVRATHEPDGDALAFRLVREGDTWLVDDPPSFAWKEPDATAAATVVTKFGLRSDDACTLLASPIADQCAALLPPEQVRYDLESVSVSGTTASITAALREDTDRYELSGSGGSWLITAID